MALPGRSFLLDGEAIVTDDKGLAVFELIRRQRHGGAAVLCAFDLIELDGEDLRRAPIEHRKRKLAKLVRNPRRLETAAKPMTPAERLELRKSIDSLVTELNTLRIKLDRPLKAEA